MRKIIRSLLLLSVVVSIANSSNGCKIAGPTSTNGT